MSEPASAPGAPREAHLEVPRTARYYTVGDPAGARALWIVLHGYGQLAGYFARHFVPHADGRLIVAPEGLSRFYVARETAAGAPARIGATWMTREDRDAEIADQVRWLDRALAAARAAVADAAGAAGDAGGEAASLAAALPLGVLGFSQGAVTACRWLLHRARAGHAPAARLVLWGGTIPHDLDLAADGAVLRRTPLVVVAGDEDEFATPTAVADLSARLLAAGIHQRVEGYAGGHRLHHETLGRVLALPAPAGP